MLLVKKEGTGGIQGGEVFVGKPTKMKRQATKL